MPTRPTTRPVAAPTAVAFPVRNRSRHTHATKAVAAAVLVFVNASAASPFAASAEPALNPNQPNHKSLAPSSTSGTLWGTIAVRLKSFRGPSIRAATSADFAGGTVVHISAGEVERAELCQPAARPPHPVRSE